MDSKNYLELYEAVYLYNQLGCNLEKPLIQVGEREKIEGLGINEAIYKAMLRILTVNQLMTFDGKQYFVTDEQYKNQNDLLKRVIEKDPYKQYTTFYNKALDDKHYFFDALNELEYEIYSRCDFGVTYEVGKNVVKHLDFNQARVLELGGNSGGLGTAIMHENPSCFYHILDLEIPCKIGNLFKVENSVELTFIEGDIFDLKLPEMRYNTIVLMNLLHDFDDEKCIEIIRNALKYAEDNAQLVIIEDLLINDFEPHFAVMQGLRVSVECRGGKQRTYEELMLLLVNFGYNVEKTQRLNPFLTLMVFKK